MSWAIAHVEASPVQNWELETHISHPEKFVLCYDIKLGQTYQTKFTNEGEAQDALKVYRFILDDPSPV